MAEDIRCVIDMGTNSVRLLIAEVSRGIRVKFKTLTTVRLGEGMTDNLTPQAMERALSAIKGYKKIIDEDVGTVPVYCFATSALRDAANAQEFCERIKCEANYDIHILSGEEEARYAFLGAAEEGTGGVLDIGGGSTEVIFGKNNEIEFSESFDIGCVRAKQNMNGDFDAVLAQAKEMFSRVDFGKYEDMLMYAVAGTATTLACMDMRLAEYEPSRVTGYSLSDYAVRRMFTQYKGMTTADRERIVGLPVERADIIGYGMAIMIAFFEVSGRVSVLVSDRDNLEGALMARL